MVGKIKSGVFARVVYESTAIDLGRLTKNKKKRLQNK